MAKQTFIWTALPNGIRNGKLRLSAILTPRLTSTHTKPTLAEFPDLVNWPSTAVAFRVQFAKGPTLAARRLSPAPESALWGALFSGETYVRSYEAERGAATVVSYPVRNLLGFVEERYRKLALAYPTQLPPASLLLDPNYFGPIRVEGSLAAQLKQVQAQLRKEQATMADKYMAAMHAAAVETARQDRVNVPIAPPPEESIGSRNEDPLPTGLGEHVRSTIDENRQQVGGQISSDFGRFGETDPTAPLPDTNPVTRPGEEVPGQLPIFFPIDTAPDPLRDFLRAGLFHLGQTPALNGDPDDREAQPMPMLPEFDFHQGVSLLGDYPSLMRRLGLVVDLEVDLTADLPDLSLCRVLPAWTAAVETTNASPWTYYEINRSAGRFMPRARPTNPNVRNGLLDLEDTEAFGLIQTDPDSAAIKVLDAVNASLDASTPDRLAGLPTLRSVGISLVRSGAGILLLQSFVTSTLHNEQLNSHPEQIAFYAEELVQGYRPDIFSQQSGRWHSLTGRVGTYEFVRTGQTEQIQDEGWVSLAATSGVSQASTDLNLHEMIFNWLGWSLATPPMEPALGDEGLEDDSTEQPLTSLQLRTQFVPPAGSLPLLRYGHTYQIRARTVDLAGNSLPFNPTDAMAGASLPITYRRLEPVGSPPIIPLVKTLPKGETVGRMAVRTYENETPEQVTEGGSSRRVAPPRSSVKQAEVHAIFDTSGGIDRYRYGQAIDRDGDFAEFEPLDPTRAEPLAVPYCPDPLARYVIFKGLPGVAAESLYKVPLNNTRESWPDLATFRITLVSGNRAPQWNGMTRELTVSIPLYEECAVKVSTGFDEADLDLLYLWHLLAQDADASRLAELRQLALDGQHWMLTPPRTLTLVHAAQKPKDPPTFIKAMAHRDLGQTTAMLSGQVQVHAKSTRAIQVFASWEETVDNESNPGPETYEADSFAFDEKVRGKDLLEVYHCQEFADTRYRQVNYRAVATSRFTEFFDLDTAANPDAYVKEGPLFAVEILSTAPPTPPQVEYVIPTFGWERPDLPVGSQIVSFRKGGGLRVYLKRPWFSSGEGEMLGVVLSDALVGGKVPAAQRPYVTHWGKDPLWQTDAPDLSPLIEHFRNAAASQTGLNLNGTPVAVVGYPVAYDSERKLWYADIELDTGRAYFPFIRLALARYQPKSVVGCHLSPVTLTDYLQVVPDRATAITHSPLKPGELSVTVSGDTYDRGPVGPAVVEVSVERTTESGETIRWEPYPAAAATLKRSRNLWQGGVILPADRAGQRFRLIISEYEQYMADDNRLQKRLVFVDVLEV